MSEVTEQAPAKTPPKEAVDVSALEESLLGPDLQCLGWYTQSCPGEVTHALDCPKGDATAYLCTRCVRLMISETKKRTLGILPKRVWFRRLCGHAVPLRQCHPRPI